MGVIFTRTVPGNASRVRLANEVIAVVNAAAGSIIVCCAWPTLDPMRWEATRALTSPENAAADAAIAAHDPNDPPPSGNVPPHGHAIGDVASLQSSLDGLAGDVDALDASKADASAMTTALAGKCANDDARLSDARTPLSHSHVIANVSGLQAALDGKSDVGHTHAGSGNPFTTFVLAADVSTAANTTPVNVTGLSFPFTANGRYVVEVFGRAQAPANTTGIGLQFDVSAAVTLVTMMHVHQLAVAGTLTGGHSVADDASVGLSSGFPTNAVAVPFYACGTLIAAGNAGTAQLRLRSEVAAVSTIRANTIMRVQSV